MTRIFRYTVLPIMLFAFVWVIFGDLVNLHMKLIFKLDINANKTLYVKTFKKHKDDQNYHLEKALNNHNNNGFAEINTEISYFTNIENFDISELDCFVNPNISHSNFGLRAPPYSL